MKNKNKLIIILLIVIIAIIAGVLTFNFIKNQESKTTEVKSVDSTIVPSKLSEPNEINEENLEVEGFQESNPELSGAVREQKHNEEELVSASSQRVYYSQIDSRWKNHPYTSIGDYSQTIGTSGCGPTSASMIVSSIKGVVYPDKMRRFICS